MSLYSCDSCHSWFSFFCLRLGYEPKAYGFESNFRVKKRVSQRWKRMHTDKKIEGITADDPFARPSCFCPQFFCLLFFVHAFSCLSWLNPLYYLCPSVSI